MFKELGKNREVISTPKKPTKGIYLRLTEEELNSLTTKAKKEGLTKLATFVIAKLRVHGYI